MQKKNVRIFRLSVVFLIACVLVVGANVTPASADVTGPLYPTSVVAIPVQLYNWTNLGNITQDDNQYAVASFLGGEGGNSAFIHATGFGFDIPPDAVINGIELTVSRYSDPGVIYNVRDLDINLFMNGALVGLNHAFPYHEINWPTTETPITYGSPTDLWDVELTPQDVNDPGFGIAFRANCWEHIFGYVDYMRMTVYYTYQGTILTAASVSGVYGDSLTVSATLSDNLSGKTINFSLNNVYVCTGTTNESGVASCSTTQKVNAGTYPTGVKATFPGAPPLGTSTDTASLTITRRPISVSAVTDTKTYDGTTASSGAPSISLGTLATGDSAAWTQAFDNRNAGASKTLNATGTISDGNAGNNYTVTYVPASGSINKLPLTLTAKSETKTYDGTTASSLKPTASVPPATGDSMVLSQSFDNRNVGTGKLITPSATIDDGNSGANYALTLTTTTGAINALSVTISAVTQTRPYDGTPNSSLTPTILPGLGQDDTANLSQAFSDSSAGTGKTITPSGTINDGNSGNNYTVTFQNATGAITPLEIHVTADAKTRPYGAVDPPLTYQHTPNLIGSDSFTGGLTREPGTDAGVYLIEQGTLSLSANYTLTYTGANFTITKLDQTITVLNPELIPEWEWIDETFTVSATSSSGLAVAYSASGGCSNAGGLFTMTSSSVDCSVHFDQAGATNYNPAPRVTVVVAAAEVPVIVQDPADAIVPTGQDAVFTTIGRGSPTPTVRWEVSTDNWQSFEVIVGETSPTLTIHLPPESSQGYQYRAVYENFHGSVTTAPATLHLLYNNLFLPTITR